MFRLCTLAMPVIAFCGFVVPLVSAQAATADVAVNDPPSNDNSIPAQRRGVAIAEIAANNVVVNLFDRSVLGDWADTNLQSSWQNIEGPWTFDEDPFPVNEIIHPIEGSLYFDAGRSNGLGFWESSGWTAAGAVMWKIMGEVEDPMINDVITTTLGGMALGEMVHRLYIEAQREDSPERHFISPFEAGNQALFGKSRDEMLDGSVDLSVESGIGAPYLNPNPSRGMASGPGFPVGEVGYSLNYGNPFGDRSGPFDYFEQRFAIAGSPSFYGVSFFSNGTLASIPILDNAEGRLSLAASLHYDYLYSSLIELSANALGLSLIGEKAGPREFRLKGELHISALALGTDENEYAREFDGPQGINEEGRDYDWCLGAEAKLYLSASMPLLGIFSLEVTCYDFLPISTIQVPSSPSAPLDYSFVGIANLSYEHSICKNLRLGGSFLLYLKDAYYDSLPTVGESIEVVSIYTRVLI